MAPQRFDLESETSTVRMKISPTLALLAAVLVTSACQRVGIQNASEQPPTPVEVAAAEVRTMPIEMHAIGAVEPIASVRLKSKVQGEILRVHFADGKSKTPEPGEEPRVTRPELASAK